MVNEGDGIVHSPNKTCRCACNVIQVRSLFGDLDGAPLEPVLECSQPDILVESSPGKWHCYYLTNDCPLISSRCAKCRLPRSSTAIPMCMTCRV